MGDGGQAARRQGVPRRSRGSPGPARWPTRTCRSGRAPTSRCSAGWCATSWTTSSTSGSTCWRTRTPRRSSASGSSTPRTATASSPASTRRPAATCRTAGSTRATRSDSGSGHTAKERDSAAGLQHESHGAQVGGETQRDETLQHPRCVYQILKRHFARYTPEMVERVCGIPQEKFLELARAWTENSGRERTGVLIYSVGWTQHSVGVQYIRTGAIIQLLLGNMGRPGGGHPGAARARQHPGLHRHPDAVQPAARLPADAAPRRPPDLRRVGGQHPAPRPEGLLGQRARRTRRACSRRTGVTRRRRRTTSATATCPG